MSTEPREVTPFTKSIKGQMFDKDFSPKIVKADEEVDDEILEAEEAMTPIPKDLSAQASALSPPSGAETSQPRLVTPVLPESPPIPTQVVSTPPDADSESGKPSESSEDEQPTSSPTPPAPATSLPPGSTKTSPGKQTPPASAKPPTNE